MGDGKQQDVVSKQSPAATRIIQSSLTVGALSGVFGALSGSFVGILRSSQPVVFALAAGIRWFGYGTTFWASRSGLLAAWEDRPDRRTPASTIAGAVSGGTISALTRTPAHGLRSMLFFGLAGFVGQHVYDTSDAAHTADIEAGSPRSQTLLERISSSKYSPIKQLTDEEYANILKEKMLKVEAEIAIVDEDIRALTKAQEAQGIRQPSND